MVDAPSNIPATITISGTATQQGLSGSTPASGVLVAAYKNSDPTMPVTMTTTDANGNYSLTVTTNGMPVDGYLKATKSGNADTYLFPPAPLVADFTMASINELSTSTYNFLASQYGQQSGQGMIVLEVVDTSNMFVAGAMVTSTPAAGTTAYTGSGGSPLPSSTATMTASDGRAYLFAYAPGSVSVAATKTGVTFKSHSVQTFANAFTTTVITE